MLNIALRTVYTRAVVVETFTDKGYGRSHR